jgi:hypothetical protein
MHPEREKNDEYYSKKPKKPDPYYQEYQPKQQHQQQQSSGGKSEKARYERSYEHRHSIQGSEPRGSVNANFSNQDPIKNFSTSDRNRDRDTRSSEPGGHMNFEHRNKPPSGQQRISNAVFQRLPVNLDSLPPRLKKKCLQEAGLPEDLTQKQIMEMTQQSYSNTLPTGRGRNNRYDQQNYHHQNYQSKYNNNNQNQGYHVDKESSYHRSITPPPSKNSRSQQQQKPSPSRYDWKTNDVQRRDESSPTNKTRITPVAKTMLTTNDDPYFDWTEEVLNSQSLPPEVNLLSNLHNKPDDNNRHRHRRRRNRR